MAENPIVGTIRTTEASIGYDPNPYRNDDIDNKISEMDRATTVGEVKDAVSAVVQAIQKSFDKFIEDQRTLHNNSVTTVADAETENTQANTETTKEIVGVKKDTQTILEDARKARQALGDGILGRISDKVTSFTNSLKPILPSLQTFGIAFATTGLGAMFMTNALISAIKFIFNNPLMFIGSLIGGSILYNMFKEPINNFITKISDKLKEWLSDILSTALTKTVKDSAKTIEGLINKFSSLNLSSGGFFRNINDSIEKLQNAIDDSWGIIISDINFTISDIFELYLPEAIKTFFDTFNVEIPKSIKKIVATIDEELPKSTEYKTIIETANGVTSALNNFHTLYNDNKERINNLIDTINKNSGLLSFFKPQKGAFNTKPNNTNSDSLVVNNGVNNKKTKDTGVVSTNIQSSSTSSTYNITPQSTPPKSPLSVIANTVGNAISTNAVNAAEVAKAKFEKDGSAELEQSKKKIEKVVEDRIAPVNSGVNDIKQGIDDGQAKLNKIGEDIGDLSKTLKFLVKLFTSKKTTETSPTSVVVSTPPIKQDTGSREQNSDDKAIDGL